eukprot:CAMPEP_0201202140 /NCGR_PEP_ID=MMETSP0851-20130426/164376_1 /ASSEMBLY_ACC=CAM_ASM_000631 /TAXON_ID=183588 /ORGANISM="Pseudo-nitzschia fraudulenta, Strain WWA7" /LENGTH=45 /DNA_ID= /DNA_START= /DNA_END= /DNA_ORIENTATION=
MVSQEKIEGPLSYQPALEKLNRQGQGKPSSLSSTAAPRASLPTPP